MKIKDCEHCEEFVYTGNGEFVCMKSHKVVIEDYIPTSDFGNCEGEQ